MTKRNHDCPALDRLHEIYLEEEVKLRVQKLAVKHHAPGIKWQTYVNPAREDGLFVGEVNEPQPYLHADGTPIRTLLHGEWQDAWDVVPPSPGGHSIGHQMPHAEAVQLVRLLNAPEAPTP